MQSTAGRSCRQRQFDSNPGLDCSLIVTRSSLLKLTVKFHLRRLHNIISRKWFSEGFLKEGISVILMLILPDQTHFFSSRSNSNIISTISTTLWKTRFCILSGISEGLKKCFCEDLSKNSCGLLEYEINLKIA